MLQLHSLSAVSLITKATFEEDGLITAENFCLNACCSFCNIRGDLNIPDIWSPAQDQINIIKYS